MTERQTLSNYGIDTETTLGSGDGHSGTSREVASLHEAVASELDEAAIDPTNAVLEAVGSLNHEEMSERELRRTIREFHQEMTTNVATTASPTEQRQQFSETLQACARDCRETYEELEPHRPFKRVDVFGPETHRHSRWHARAKARREVAGHGELVRELYEERLEELAEQEGWE